MEAETTCVDLCKRGIVDAVLTEDTDVLAYGVDIFLSKIDTKNETICIISYEDILSHLNLNNRQFTELCIMCGTDYNTNINKVGPSNAFKLLTKYGSIDNIALETEYDISCLNHKRVLELFENYTKSEVDKIPNCGKPNFEMLEEFLVKKNIKYNISNIKEAFESKLIIS